MSAGTFIASVLATGTFAQTPRPPVHFTVFAAKPVADLTFLPRPDAPPQKVTFYPTARSPRYEYTGAMPLRFVDANSGAELAEANIPPGLQDALLLFIPLEPAAASGMKPDLPDAARRSGFTPDTAGHAAGANAKTAQTAPVRPTQPPKGSTAAPEQTTAAKPSSALRYQIDVLDDSWTAHGAGTLLVLNLSGNALAGTIGSDALTLRPGLNGPLIVAKPTALALQTVVRGRTYQAYADTVNLGPKQRALLLLLPPFYKGSVELQSRMLIDAPAVPARKTSP